MARRDGAAISSANSDVRLGGAAVKSWESASSAPHAHASARGRHSQVPRAARARSAAGGRSVAVSGSSARPRRDVIRSEAGGCPRADVRVGGDSLGAAG